MTEQRDRDCKDCYNCDTKEMYCAEKERYCKGKEARNCEDWKEWKGAKAHEKADLRQVRE